MSTESMSTKRSMVKRKIEFKLREEYRDFSMYAWIWMGTMEFFVKEWNSDEEVEITREQFEKYLSEYFTGIQLNIDFTVMYDHEEAKYLP